MKLVAVVALPAPELHRLNRVGSDVLVLNGNLLAIELDDEVVADVLEVKGRERPRAGDRDGVVITAYVGDRVRSAPTRAEALGVVPRRRGLSVIGKFLMSSLRRESHSFGDLRSSLTISTTFLAALKTDPAAGQTL